MATSTAVLGCLFMLLALAVALGQSRGLLLVAALFILFAALFEVIYQKTQALIARNRGKWWAKQYNTLNLRIYFLAATLVITVLVKSPFARYSLMALVVGGTICAVIIHFVQKGEEFSTIQPGTAPGSAIRRDPMTGSCEHCGANFELQLLHNGFGDCSYAYCNRCGMTTILDCWCKKWPKGIPCSQSEILEPMEEFLEACECGGRFTKGNSPRCPACRQPLSPVRAATYIEAQARAKGWRWQRNWRGLYCVIINGRRVADNFKTSSSHFSP